MSDKRNLPSSDRPVGPELDALHDPLADLLKSTREEPVPDRLQDAARALGAALDGLSAGVPAIPPLKAK